jgi:hypothetical protein
MVFSSGEYRFHAILWMCFTNLSDDFACVTDFCFIVDLQTITMQQLSSTVQVVQNISAGLMFGRHNTRRIAFE